LSLENRKSPKPTYISLFSGCGGFDIGFEESGFQSLGSFDIDALALKNLNSYLGSPVYECDLTGGKLPVSFKNAPDVVLSGSPCQGFSTIGKRDINDPRNSLLLAGARIALDLGPKIFVAENVPGVISGAHKKFWEELKKMVVLAGYKTTEIMVSASDFGVPQKRKRMLFFAWKGDHDFVELPRLNSVSLQNALSDLDGVENHEVEEIDKNSRELIIAKNIKPGQKLSNVRGGERSIHTWDIPEVFGYVSDKEKSVLCEMISLRRRLRVRSFGDADPVERKVVEDLFGCSIIDSLINKNYLREIGDRVDLVGGFNGKYRRLSFDQPSYTVDTRFGNAKNFLHPSEHRGFTVRESARIQGFSDNYIFSGPKVEQYRMIGNAVPPPMSHQIAKHIKRNFLEI